MEVVLLLKQLLLILLDVYKRQSLISKVVNNPYGFYFVIFVPFAILVVMETIDIINERRILKKKKK